MIGFTQERTNPKNQDKELGKVSWYRDYDTALTVAEKEGKSVLVLFQEVPGCATCRNYGKDVLSNTLMVEAIENEFIPLAIFNNKGGKDKQVLQLYDEPTWNNPVVRIVDKDGQNLVKRIAGNYSAKALYDAMITVLNKTGKEIPVYMKLLGEELAATENNRLDEKYYKMYCFWTGEKQLGSVKGVINTEAGFMKGAEVVKVTYDRNITDATDLNEFAKKNKMAPIEKDKTYRQSTKDEDYYLSHSKYKNLNLSDLQRTKINSALGRGKSAERYLSPRQLEALN